MSTFLKKAFLDEPKPRSVRFRYGWLAFILVCFASLALLCIFDSHPNRHGRYFPLILPMMVLTLHLALSFRWSLAAAVTLRLLAYLWLIIAWAFLLFELFT